MDETDRRVAIG